MPPSSAPDAGPAPRRRVALYGGSFNPPHLGHVLIATYALCTARFDEVRLVPTKGHAFGKDLAPFEARCEMVAAACAHLGPAVVVDPIEGRLPSPSYTIDTVRAMLAAEPGLALTLIMGTDSYLERERWKSWEELESLVELLVIGREGYAAPHHISVPFTLPDVSSTGVRRSIQAGTPDLARIPPSVLAIVRAQGLYR